MAGRRGARGHRLRHPTGVSGPVVWAGSESPDCGGEPARTRISLRPRAPPRRAPRTKATLGGFLGFFFPISLWKDFGIGECADERPGWATVYKWAGRAFVTSYHILRMGQYNATLVAQVGQNRSKSDAATIKKKKKVMQPVTQNLR